MKPVKEQKRKFQGVWIPRAIWLDETLSIIEKALMVEIDSLDNENGCIAGNTYFAKFFQISERQVKRYVSRLKDEGWIEVELIGRTQRRIHVSEKYAYLRDISVTQTRDGNVPHEGQKGPSNEGHKRHHSNTEENNTFTSLSAGAEVNEIIDLFQHVNPSWERLFARKQERTAVERMLARHGRAQLEKIIRYLPQTNGQAYAPTITRPAELEEKMGKLASFLQKKRSGSKVATIPS